MIGTNTGHGHVWERPDGMKARCGGPGMCPVCSRDQIRIKGIPIPVGTEVRIDGVVVVHGTPVVIPTGPQAPQNGVYVASKPHHITSRSELRQILEDVKIGKLSVQDAFANIDLTLRQGHLSLADWMQKQVDQIRMDHAE